MSRYTLFEIHNLFELQFFSSLDYYFADSMSKAFDETDSIVLASCALVSKVLSEGHICLDIQKTANTVLSVSKTIDVNLKFPGFDDWLKALENSSIVSKISGDSDTIETPLVLDSSHRLYFSKYFDFQNRLIGNIARRFFLKPLFMDEAIVDEMIAASFVGENRHISNQKKTVKNAVCNNFTVISGGPGTGKTFITSIIKDILLSYAAKQDLVKPKIICVAPTGKAASKMENGSTIHSILKPLKNTPGFYHNKNNLLLTDVIIIDEASMVDISLLTRLLEAVPVTAKVIMLGDKNQLSSIQAGSVFSDICSVKSLVPNIFFLEYNFRSKGKTGIENLSKAINNSDIENLEFILSSGQYPDIVFVPLNAPSTESFDNSDIDKKPFKKIIMINTNDYKKGLFNGDTGVCFEHSFKNGFEISEEKEVFFKSLDNGLKQYRVLDLPDNDTAFAITIHKSQGSEFKTVLIILPDKLSPVVTRQLLYTGVTRAKTKVIVVGDLNIIKKAISLSVERNSGMTEYLAQKIKSGK